MKGKCMYSEDNFYTKATKSFINYSSNDATAIIAREHALLGLSRLIACLNYLGSPCEDVRMIALPDFTYTRNPNRWEAGFPYGCIIYIPQMDIPFIPIDFRPNCCGVTFAEIPTFNENLSNFRNRYMNVIRKYSKVDHKDLNRRNHFFAIYHNIQNNKYYCLLHCSFKFVKHTLYSEHNKLLEGIKTYNFFSQDFHYLIGKEAEEYYNMYLQLEKETLSLRSLIIHELFNDAHILLNRTHEGFMGINTYLLGAYADCIEFTYPLMLSPDSNLYVVNVNKEIELCSQRSIYCAPHGGGYALDSIVSAHISNNRENDEEYVLQFSNNCSFLTNNILDMPFNYRNNTAHDWCTKYSIAEIKETLLPIINLKL